MKKEPIKIIDTGAIFSGDNVHRYSLWRTWNYDLPRIMFIGLNPSRADATKTILPLPAASTLRQAGALAVYILPTCFRSARRMCMKKK